MAETPTVDTRNLWAAQTQANYEARQILGIGSKEQTIGDLPDEAFEHAVALGLAKSLKDLDEQYGLECFYREIDTESGLLYFCDKCGRRHYRTASKIGEKHIKYELHWALRALRDRQFYQKYLSGIRSKGG